MKQEQLSNTPLTFREFFNEQSNNSRSGSHGVRTWYQATASEKTRGKRSLSVKVIFTKDMQKERNLEINEQALKEIISNKGICQEEAFMVMSNPF